MPEALAYLADFLAEGGEAAEASTAAGGEAAQTGHVSVNVPAVVQEKAAKAAKEKSKTVVQKASDIKDMASAAVPSIDDFPTGGVSLLLFIILFVVFAITITANGKTRLQTVWAAILGNAMLGGNTGQTSSATAAAPGSAAATQQALQGPLSSVGILADPNTGVPYFAGSTWGLN